jgi:formate hydrogenlyase transcriptional activator
MDFDQKGTQSESAKGAFDGLGVSAADLHKIIDAIPTLAWCAPPSGSDQFLNRRWLEYTGVSRDEGLGSLWKTSIHPDDLGRLTTKWETLLASGEPGESEARLRRSDGAYRWFLFRVEPLRNATGEIAEWYGTAIDIEDRKRTEALRTAEKRTLEMIADGESLDGILNNLCSSIDVQASSTISTILLMEPDRNRLWHAAGPLVPRAWLPAISPRAIGPNEGCCGTAAYLKKRVIVADVSTDPVWPDNIRDLAIQNGIRAAWSEPILTKDGEVLGTFALYSPESRTPTAAELELIAGAGHIALIAIGRQRSQEALRKSEAELRRITDAIPQCIGVLGVDGRTLYVNRVMLEYAGVGLEDITAPDFPHRVFHPDDLERFRADRQLGLSGEVPFELEQRLRRHDGTYRWFLVRYNPFRDEQGRVARWYATATDIDERRRAEERIQKENRALREEIDRSSMFEEIVGSSDALRRLLSQVAKVAPTDSTVLICGETGTGKELVARAIHAKSKRAARAFVRVNCAAIPQELIASELFGHEKGAFSGALQRRIGRFESADGGTLFLDEVGDLPAETQIALLRVLQEREFERVGSNEPIAVDVRLLAATNRDVKAAMAEGTFREDLFYRLNVFPIVVPSLRERADDIPLLVEYLAQRSAERSGKKIRHIEKATLDLFKAYSWPGNIRELQNVVERAVILCDGDTLSVDETWFKHDSPRAPPATEPLTASLVERERETIETALKQSRGRIAGPFGAAARLGIPRQTLDSKIATLGIDKYRFKA